MCTFKLAYESNLEGKFVVYLGRLLEPLGRVGVNH
jgi:hypothetical protein